MDGKEKLILPDIPGEGAIFAFSGLDGKTDIAAELVMTTLRDQPGFHIRYPSEGKFFPRFCIGGVPVSGFPCNTKFTLVCGDAIDMTINVADGVDVRLRYIAVDNSTLLGEASCDNPSKTVSVELVLEESSRGRLNLSFTDGEGRRKEFNNGFKTQFYLSAGTPQKYDFEAEYKRKLSFFEGLPLRKNIDAKILKTLLKCFSVLKTNYHSAQGTLKNGWSTPDRYPHRYAWLWDTAFQTLGLKYISPKAAEDALKTVLAKQRQNGFIPHMMTPDNEGDSKITQPPLLSWAIWNLYDYGRSNRLPESVFPRLVKLLKYFMMSDHNSNGLLEWTQGGEESGMDNSPRFDSCREMDAVDLNSYVANSLFYLGKIAAHLDESAMVEYCHKKRDIISRKINSILWNEEDGIYYDLGQDGKHIRVKTVASFTPLFAGIVPRNRVERLVSHIIEPEEFNRAMPVSSVSADEPSFSDDMWRGPVWANYNYMIIEGLKRYGYHDEAEHITERTIGEISRWYHEDGVIYEFFDSEGTKSPKELKRKGGCGGDRLNTNVRDYSWTASVFIELILSDDRSIR